MIFESVGGDLRLIGLRNDTFFVNGFDRRFVRRRPDRLGMEWKLPMASMRIRWIQNPLLPLGISGWGMRSMNVYSRIADPRVGETFWKVKTGGLELPPGKDQTNRSTWKTE